MIKDIFTSSLFCLFTFLVYHFTSSINVSNQEQIISLRNIGHKILLRSGDSKSRILPIKQLPNNSFEIHFEKPFALFPDSLYDIIRAEGISGTLPENYFVNVYDCESRKLQYAYHYPLKKGESPPCIGRQFPKNCYFINIVEKQNTISSHLFILLISVSLFFGWKFKNMKNQNKQRLETDEMAHSFLKIGKVEFYPSLQKIVIDNKNIKLTGKESHILQIFAENINIEIAREKLQKEVWEDDGIIVGRSLDMFISKLRKKLGINIVSVHGRGYKLIVE